MSEEAEVVDTSMKKPFIIIGNPYIECYQCKNRIPKPVGVYLHAILTELQTSDYIYLYYFEDKATMIAELAQLLKFVGMHEIYKRYIVEVPAKKNPELKWKRYEVRLDKIAALKSLVWR